MLMKKPGRKFLPLHLEALGRRLLPGVTSAVSDGAGAADEKQLSAERAGMPQYTPGCVFAGHGTLSTGSLHGLHQGGGLGCTMQTTPGSSSCLAPRSGPGRLPRPPADSQK